jgi:hypothetical protein
MFFAKFVRNVGKRLSEQEKDLEIDVMNNTLPVGIKREASKDLLDR